MTAAVRSPVKPLLAGLIVLGAVLSILVVPGLFTVDENNYLVNVLALQQGRVTLANTEGLTPSRELLFFDPANRARAVTSTPVGSAAPPLYAILALPFSYFGWRGLTALNTLSYLATTLIVFVYARRYAQHPSTPWFAAAAVAIGGYTIEYALGLWPHALSFALCAAGIAAVGRAIDPETHERSVVIAAAIGGLLLALAAGVRYQNAVVLAAAGTALALLASSRRVAACLAYGAAAGVLLATSAAFNHARFGSWNPISKGPGYFTEGTANLQSAWTDPFLMFWGQLVDYSWRPQLDPGTKAWLHYDPTTGAHLIYGAIAKKAVLQSAPWAILAFAIFVAAWMPRVQMPDERRRQLRLVSIVAAAIVFTFSVSPVGRHDGLSFNGRYFLELLPLAAVAFAWALDGGVSTRTTTLVIGAAVGAALAAAIVYGTPLVGGPAQPLWLVRQAAIMKAPLVLAILLLAAWLFGAKGRPHAGFLGGAAAACLAWGLVLHASTDVTSARAMRTKSLLRSEILADAVPDKSAIVAYWGNADAAGPLLFSRDVVVLDAAADHSHDAPRLIRELLHSHRRVFLLPVEFPPEEVHRLVDGLIVVPVPQSHSIREVRLPAE